MCTCIAWEPESSHDGVGAQVLRIIDSFSVAKFLNLGFVYRPILHFERNPGDGLKEYQKEQFLFELNKFLDLNHHTCLNIHDKKLVRLSRYHQSIFFTRLYFSLRRKLNVIKQRNELIIIPNLDVVTHRNPDVRRMFMMTKIKAQKKQFNNSLIQIHVHIRRGWITNRNFMNRYVPTSWYVSILTEIQDFLDRNETKALVTLHTDINERNKEWDASDYSQGTKTYLSENGIDLGEEMLVSLNYEDFAKVMSKIKNLRIVSEIDPVQAWTLMSEADILILGKSTFSYVGALLCNPRIVISPVGFLGVLSGWFSSSDEGLLNKKAIKSLQKLVDSTDKF